VIVGAVVAFGIVVSTVPGTPLGANPWLVALAGLIGIGALVVGFVRWLGGSGALLVVAVIDLAILAIPIGGVLTGASSGVFSDRGLVLTVALAVALTVAGLLAPIRLDDRDRLATGERLVVLGAGLAVAVIFGLASNDSANGLIYLGCLQLAAIVAWWNGSGWLLGFTSLAGVVLVGLAVLVGHWTAAGALTQAGILSGSVIGLLAAFRQIGRHPTDRARRTEGQPGVGGDSEPDAPPTT
jgi:hypothetical protein